MYAKGKIHLKGKIFRTEKHLKLITPIYFFLLSTFKDAQIWLFEVHVY